MLRSIRRSFRSCLGYLRLVPVFLVCVVVAAAMVFAADIGVHITEWELPEGTFPHDPAVAPDGALWYTGMQSNTIGRLDPKTGKIREYKIPTPDSGPHGLVADNQGNIWFTANFKGYIGSLDPKTGTFREYPMSDPAARDPHTLVFDRKGMLWFTVQGGNFVGRLDPASGQIKLRKIMAGGARPYGIVVNSKGIPFFCQFGRNRLASIDPETMEITEYPLPEGARPRRIAVTPDDRVYYTDFARGRIGWLDAKTGAVGDILSPGGAESAPYGMAATPDGIVWYSESGVKPNTIVRFDPRTKTFGSWLVPSGGGVIRHMAATAGGYLYIACSGENKVGTVAVSAASQ
ncbi:MAG: lyase [Nitrospirae bacterium]|nr:lyase [Nitrospirota bacterium]